MRTETRTYDVYKVDELSFTAKENAYNRWLAGYEYPWQSENMATLKAFEGYSTYVYVIGDMTAARVTTVSPPITARKRKDFAVCGY